MVDVDTSFRAATSIKAAPTGVPLCAVLRELGPGVP
jgi:hypothetical protein